MFRSYWVELSYLIFSLFHCSNTLIYHSSNCKLNSYRVHEQKLVHILDICNINEAIPFKKSHLYDTKKYFIQYQSIYRVPYIEMNDIFNILFFIFDLEVHQRDQHIYQQFHYVYYTVIWLSRSSYIALHKSSSINPL